MKKILLVLTLTLGTLVSNAQSIGTFVGFTTKSLSQLNGSWGGWVSTEKFGIEYSYSSNINIEVKRDSYLSQTSKSYGVTYIIKSDNEPHLSFIPSIGIQSNYSTFDKQIHNKTWTKDIYPYVSISGEYDLNSALNVRVRMQIGKVSTIGAGIGIRLGKY